MTNSKNDFVGIQHLSYFILDSLCRFPERRTTFTLLTHQFEILMGLPISLLLTHFGRNTQEETGVGVDAHELQMKTYDGSAGTGQRLG